jgi:hypothetical protein
MFDNYFIKLNKIFKIINKFENDKLNPKSFLEGPESITGLNRLN